MTSAMPPHFVDNSDMMGENGKQMSSTMVLFFNMVNGVTQLLIGAVAMAAFTFAIIIVWPSSVPQHIYLCVTGYVILMSQAILSFHGQAGWANSLNYSQKKLLHGILQILGSILAIAGSGVRIADLNQHFNTAHATMGMVAMIFTCLSLIGGIMTFVAPKQTNSTIFKTMHACFGCLTITMAFTALIIAMHTHYRSVFLDANANLFVTFAVFALLGIIISASSRTIQRFFK